MISQKGVAYLRDEFRLLDKTKSRFFATAVASSRETRPTHCLAFAPLREIKIIPSISNAVKKAKIFIQEVYS
ncbi:hypothetical protein H6G33_21605 [Calothrix sp. FACHB-1219]|uniref:hypothetical protein n=1 Tax=unclassified Calothrix TaxID=2619626 RepID=UPI0016838FFE|nr:MULTISPECIES: hypothetical protein [unclassified Calothrix]MBD2203799.1 hypothetical protein [Calothrix sp. FACHB-168]MBD2219617.1 hypothetical protein [Calothrix sp. FACHB-1219]